MTKQLLIFITLFLTACGGVVPNDDDGDGDGKKKGKLKDFRGIEECQSSRGVRSLATRRVGPYWNYRYRGRSFQTDMGRLAAGDSEVRHVGEEMLSYRCRNNRLYYRESLRIVELLNKNKTLHFRDEVFCVGSFPSGMVEGYYNGWDPCRDEE